jgi:surface protein
MAGAYHNCKSIGPNGYFYSNKVNTVTNCFYNRNVNSRMNLYVPSTGYNFSHNTYKSCLFTATGSTLVGNEITWTNDNNCHYNTAYNIYIYPVANVREAYMENELSVAIYTMNSGANVLPSTITGANYTINDTNNDDGTVLRKIILEEEGVLTNLSFRDVTGLLTVEKLKLGNITNASYMFSGCTNLTSVNISTSDVINVKNADYMFKGCTNLTTINDDFELPNVETAVEIFDGCTKLK